MFNRLLLLCVAIVAICGCASADANVAYSDSQVRFTVVTPGTIRMEYAPDGRFVDDKTFIAVNRDYPAVDYKVKKGSWIEITTSKMKLRYRRGSGPFTASNLSIASIGLKPAFTWRPGQQQTGNLKGTFRTLDKFDGDSCTGKLADCEPGMKMPIEPGLIATDGWTLVDDSQSLLLDSDPEWEWVKERTSAKGAQDWYFMAYGHDYKTALSDYALFAGKMPLPPRYTFGYWWSRYWMYSDRELRNLVADFKSIGMPLDVLVIDMDWHYTDKKRGAWTGWTWNRELFPDYPRLLSDLKKNGYKLTLNLHPADGVKAYEEKYPQMAASLGIDTTASRPDIKWIGSDKKFVSALFDNILTPMENNGVGFWWLDWQQHLYDPVIKNLKNTWWCSYIFYTHMERYGDRRPLIYHRWSGLGNHRYQVGFSGDTWITWKSLDFQPYFNSTASNVLYGYWSHDLGGHMQGINRIDPEMYVRWLQFGAFSPVMRTHSTKAKGLEKEPWIFSRDVNSIILNTVRQRYDLAPYIYTMARKAYDESLGLCRPMYYDYPEQPEAYSFRNQYMFGDDMMIAPVTAPMSGKYSVQEVWLPEGEWFELPTGQMLQGGQTVTRHFALDEYPVYVKAGSILPFHTASTMNLDANDEPIQVNVFPGASGSFTMYEDNGTGKDYATNYATTELTNTIDGRTQTITIAPRKGTYKDMPANRQFSVKVNNAQAPESVTVNGKPATFSYNGTDFALEVEIPSTDCSTAKTVSIVYPETTADLNGLKGAARRVARAMEQLKSDKPHIIFVDPFSRMGSVSEAVTYYPADFVKIVNDFRTNYGNLDNTAANLQKIQGDALSSFISTAKPQ